MCKAFVCWAELWTHESISWKAGPRHAELIRESFNVTGQSVSTPGVRDRPNDIEGEVPISKEAADRYRANTMRAQYLSSDRPEIISRVQGFGTQDATTVEPG